MYGSGITIGRDKMLSLELSLNDVEEMYRAGRVREAEVEDYIRRWNEKLRFTMAVLRDGRIRNVLRKGEI